MSQKKNSIQGKKMELFEFTMMRWETQVKNLDVNVIFFSEFNSDDVK